ncbi:DUF2090 domain-containing protein [Candidatus Microgenomates bacterium]|nr:MAG: DUF2090 domain-containing protein [Candidatus Microgenomates bacterium]
MADLSKVIKNENLFFLAFDHRASFLKLLNIEHRATTPEEVNKICELKQIIYDGFKKALESNVPKEQGAILVDEQFGEAILKDAKNNNFIFALPVEKSGEKEFDFEYGNEFEKHIKDYDPAFAKVLVHYNPEGDEEINYRQRKKLQDLGNYCQKNGKAFLMELIVEPTKLQMEQSGNDKNKYDQELRPMLAIKTIKEMQKDNIEPDIWKIEGMEKKEDYYEVLNQAQSNGRNAKIVVLGRGEDKLKVEKWLKAGALVKGVIGFAIGRTIFNEPIINYLENKIKREEAVEKISDNYKYFYKFFIENSI